MKQGGKMLLPLMRTYIRQKGPGIPRALVRAIHTKGTCIILCPVPLILLVVYRGIFVSLRSSHRRILAFNSRISISYHYSAPVHMACCEANCFETRVLGSKTCFRQDVCACLKQDDEISPHVFRATTCKERGNDDIPLRAAVISTTAEV